MSIKLSTGKIAFPIEFDNGDKDVIYFNPNDPELGSRLIGTKSRIEERMKNMKIDDVEIPEGVKLTDLENVESLTDIPPECLEVIEKQGERLSKIVNESKRIVCEELDNAFESEISKVVFKHCSPFAVVDGNYFVLQFLEVITAEIRKKQSNKTNPKVMNHVGKYLK